MKQKFLEAIDKVTDKLLSMTDDEFYKKIEIHKKGKYISAIKDIILPMSSYCYEVTITSKTIVKSGNSDFKKCSGRYDVSPTYTKSIGESCNDIMGESWTQIAA